MLYQSVTSLSSTRCLHKALPYWTPSSNKGARHLCEPKRGGAQCAAHQHISTSTPQRYLSSSLIPCASQIRSAADAATHGPRFRQTLDDVLFVEAFGFYKLACNEPRLTCSRKSALGCHQVGQLPRVEVAGRLAERRRVECEERKTEPIHMLITISSTLRPVSQNRRE